MSLAMNRRAMLAALGVGVATAQAAGLLWPAAAAAETAPAGFVERICDLVIPATDTPGALAAGVPAFLALAVQHGLEGAPQDALSRFERALDAEAVRQGTAGFARAPAAQQVQILTDVDARVFARGGPPVSPADLALWSKVKALIVAGYYTSEIGGSKELRYELVPGRFDPDLPLAPGERAWSSDWTAVTFG